MPGSPSIKRLCPLFFILIVILISCSPEPKIKNPDTITIGFLADAKNLLPLLASDSASGDISGLLFNGLTKYDKDIKIIGDLASSWEIKNGGLEIVFRLREGVRWHDGEELTSDDVVFTYRTVIDPKVPTPYSSNYGPVERGEARDRYTVRVIYSEPY